MPDYNNIEIEKTLTNGESLVKNVINLSRTGYNNYNSFNVYKNFEDVDPLEGGYAYFFFTRPQINLEQDKSMLKKYYPFFYEHLGGVKDLNPIYSNMFKGNGFVYPLTNLGLSFETQDTILETDEYNETFRGYKIVAPTTSVKSRIAGDFSIEYLETSDMFITTYHKLWMDYIEGVREGVMIPKISSVKKDSNSDSSRNTGTIDYMNSLYYFITEPDGMTIRYYAKYTGIFPTNIPYSTFKWNLGSTEGYKFTVNYTYNFKEDLNPAILWEFNSIQQQESAINLTNITDGTLSGGAWKRAVRINRHKSKYILEFGDQIGN